MPPKKQAVLDDQRSLLERYSGRQDEIRLSSWLNLYNVITDGKSDKDKVTLLMRYLKGEALAWYADEITKDPKISWDECSVQMLSRFGEPLVRPLVAAQRRIFSRQDTVQKYFDEKMRLLRQCDLDDTDIVSQLTEGMPMSYRTSLIVAQPSAAVQWLTVALQLEQSYAKYSPRTTPQTNFMSKPGFNNNKKPFMDKQPARKPPTACKICEKLNKPNQWHWHSDCPNRNTQANKQPANEANNPTPSTSHLESDTPAMFNLN